MASVTAIVVNPREHRLRLFWRLVATIAVLAVALMLIAPAQLALEPASSYADPLMNLIAIGLVLLVAARWIDRRPFEDYGLRKRRLAVELAGGVLLGASAQLLLFGALLVLGWATGVLRPRIIYGPLVLPAVALPILLLAHVAIAVAEELLLRGYIVKNFAEAFGRRSRRAGVLAAVLVAAVLFGAAHASNPHASPLATANIVLAGVWLGLCFAWTGRLALPIGVHLGWNFFEGPVLGMPVSGSMPPAALLETSLHGPTLWTGGAFGPEAGLLSVIVVTFMTGVTALALAYFTGKVRIDARLARYRPRQSRKSGRHAATGAESLPSNSL